MNSPDRDVFLSYRHDGTTATWVRDVLVPALSEDFSVILDVNDFRPGQIILEEMEASAARARVTVAVVDERYEKSWFTRYEAALSETLLVVQRDGGDPVPATHTLRLHDDDPAPVVAEVDRLIKRVLVLESEADREFATGFLIPALRAAHIDAKDVTDVGVLNQKNAPAFEDLEQAIEWADRVIVVVSRAYMNDLGKTKGRLLQQYQHADRIDLTLPVVIESPHDDDDPYQVPAQFNSALRIDLFDQQLWLQALQKICQALDVPPPRPTHPPPCPYPGMRPYGADDNYPFVGRDDEIRLVLDQLRRDRRTAVVIGPSGSGKSSLVLAGVVPLVGQQGLDDRLHCSIEIITPTHRIDEARNALEATAHPTGSRLLIVDQLEQAFTLTPPPNGAESDAGDGGKPGAGFLRELAKLRSDDPDLHIILTVRADFYSQLMVSPLWDLVKLDMIPITPLEGEPLRRAIREPAGSLGVKIADSLVVNLARETEGEPGLMPFLQEALRKLWGRQPWWYLSISDAEWDSGEFGVSKAIRQQSDEALKKIQSEFGEKRGNNIVRSILLKLVNFGEGGRYTRHQVAVETIVEASPDPGSFRRALDILGDEQQRIVTLGDRSIVENGTTRHVQSAELSHEAIIDGWPDFRQWIDQHHVVEIERRSWTNRVEGELLVGRDLIAAEQWLAKSEEVEFLVDPELVDYVQRSRREQDARTEEERQRVENEALEKQRSEDAKRRRLLVGLVASLVVIAGMAILSVYALRARNSARDSQRIAESETDRRVATQLQTSASAYQGGLALQAILVRAADLIDENGVGALEMLVTVEREPGIGRRIDATSRNVGFEAATLLADGRVVIGDGRGRVSIWAQGASQPSATTEVGHGVLAIAQLAGSPYIAVAGGNSTAIESGFDGSDGWVDILDTSNPSLTSTRLHLGGDSPVATTWWDDDRLIVGTWDGTIAVIDVSDPLNPVLRRSFDIPGPPEATDCSIDSSDRKVRSLAMDGNRRWLVAGANHCIIAVWDARTFDLVDVLTAHTSKVRAVAFVPGTSELLSTGDDSTIRSWQLEDGASATTLVGSVDDGNSMTSGDGHRLELEGRVVTMCVSPDGSGVVTAGRDHLVRRWTRVSGLIVDTAEFDSHTTTVRGVSCPTNTTFTSVAGDGFVLWDLDRPNRWGQPLGDQVDGAHHDVTVRPDDSGQIAVSSSGVLDIVGVDGTTHRLDPTERTNDLPLVEYSNGGEVIVAIGRGVSGWPDEIIVYDSVERVAVARYPASGAGRLTALAVVDETNFAAGMNTGEILVVHDGDERIVPIPTGRLVTAIGLSANGHLLAGDDGGTLFCTRLDTSVDFASVELGRRVNDIAVADDGTVAVGTADGMIRSYSGVVGEIDPNGCDPETWVGASPPIVHESIGSLDLTRDGEILIAATSNGAVEIWDMPRLRLIGSLTLSGDDPAVSVSIHPDIGSLAVGGESTALRFDLDRTGLGERLCEIAGRNLTEDEAAAFLPLDRYREVARCFE